MVEAVVFRSSEHQLNRKTAGWRELKLKSNEISGQEILQMLLADRSGKEVFRGAKPVLEFQAPQERDGDHLASFIITAKNLPNVRIVGHVRAKYESHSKNVSLWAPIVEWMIDF